jgi:hypothetical protein
MTQQNYTKVSEIQNVTNDLLREIAEIDVIVTEKLDGTSARVGFQDRERWCGGHNHILTIGEKHQYDGFGWGIFVAEHRLAERIEELSVDFENDLALYGEFCGPKIQANPYKLPDYQFFVFDARSQGRWLSWDAMLLITKTLGLPTPPVEIFRDRVTKEQLEELYNAPSTLNPELQHREGIVVKAYDEEARFSDGRRMILKWRTYPERKPRKKKTPSPAAKHFQKVKNAVDEYMTEERVKKAASHLREENTEITFRSLLDELAKDILKEADSDHRELFDENAKDYMKAISKLFGSNSLFRSYVPGG